MKFLHALLYAPLLLVVAAETVKAAFVLAHGHRAGVYCLPYAVVLYFLGRRANRAWRGEIPRPAADAALVALGAGLWAFIFVSQFR